MFKFNVGDKVKTSSGVVGVIQDQAGDPECRAPCYKVKNAWFWEKDLSPHVEPKRHKHADIIIAWANGAEIEHRSAGRRWERVLLATPSWNENSEYRVKPNHPTLADIAAQTWAAHQRGDVYLWRYIAEAIKKAIESGEYTKEE